MLRKPCFFSLVFNGYIDHVTGTLRFGIFLTVILKRYMNGYIENATGTLFWVQCLTVILIALRER